MSDLVVRCDFCGKIFLVPPAMAERKARCPCGRNLTIPDAESAPNPEDLPSAPENADTSPAGQGSGPPEPPPPLPDDEGNGWYCAQQGLRIGPLEEEDIRELAQTGVLEAVQLVYGPPLGNWRPPGEIESIDVNTERGAPEARDLAPGEGKGNGESKPAEKGPEPDQTGVPSGEEPKAEGEKEWFCKIQGTRVGPMPMEDLEKVVRSGQVKSDDMIRNGNSGKWFPVSEHPDLAALARQNRPARATAGGEPPEQLPESQTLAESLTELFLNKDKNRKRKRSNVAHVPSTVLTVEYVDEGEGMDAALRSLEQRLSRLEHLTESLEEITSQLVSAVGQQNKETQQMVQSLNRRVDRVFQEVQGRGLATAPQGPATSAGAEEEKEELVPPQEYAEDKDHQHAWQIAQVMANDLDAYYPEEVQEGVMYGNLEELLSDPIGEARNTYQQRVPQHVREEFDYFDLALQKLIARKKAELQEEESGE